MFFFDDTATTEIYTYRHTLSLHDALAILVTTFRSAATMRPASRDCSSRPPATERNVIPAAAGSDMPPVSSTRRFFLAARSEEHTSELQSLMRISYAVFCLKKKTRHRTHQALL